MNDKQLSTNHNATPKYDTNPTLIKFITKSSSGLLSASSGLSIIAYYFFYYFNLQPELYSAIFFGGTFIGMSAPKRFGVYTITSAAMIFAILFEYLVPKINNYGGALGISPFLSVCACHIFILFGAPRSKKR
jgi:hypothetical protein